MRKPGDVRQSLLEAALELIWTNSYTSVGVDEICGKAGVKKGSFYYYFPSKAELAVAAYELHWENRKPELDRIFYSDESPLRKLELWVESVAQKQFRLFETHGFVCGCPFSNLGSELGTLDEKLRSQSLKLLESTYGYLIELMLHAKKQGELDLEDPEHAARGLHALVIGQVLLSKVHNDPHLLLQLPSFVRTFLGPKASTK